MTKRYIIKPYYLLILAAISCLICINALRTNNLTMVRLRANVYQADKSNTNVEAALSNLQHYVTTHMNTSLTAGANPVYPPIQLEYTYARLQTAAIENEPTNVELYTDAQVYCQQLDSTDFSGRNRVPCIQQYVLSHGASAPKTIPASLYEFDFVSPSWSPDLAGWTAVSTVVLLLAAVILFIVQHLRRK